MSEKIWYFENSISACALTLPVDFHQAIDDWSDLRSRMIRDIPPAFSRDEWAYLVAFLDPANLENVFRDAFGTETGNPGKPLTRLYRPRGDISVWLPNNVSLLGPLTLVLLSLTGQTIRLKLGSAAVDLAGAFLDFARKSLREGELSSHLLTEVTAKKLARDAPEQKLLAEATRVRIVFGSDDAARDIHGLPHPLESRGFSFVDRQSEVWMETSVVSDEILSTLIRVFAIYGQAGCTSPRRVVLLDGTEQELVSLRNRLLELWPSVMTADPAMHIASSSTLGVQHARALGWDAVCTPRNSAVLATGSFDLPRFDAPMGLSLHAGTREEALSHLPGNIQTVGHALSDSRDPAWTRLLAGSRVLRFVPLSQVHYFNSNWDGEDFWRQCFESMEVRL